MERFEVPAERKEIKGMLKRFWSMALVACAVLLFSSTLVSAEARRSFDPFLTETSNLLLVRTHRGATAPAPLIVPQGTSEPGDDDAPNRDGGSSPVLDEGKGLGSIEVWSFKSLGTGIRMHLLKYFSALR